MQAEMEEIMKKTWKEVTGILMATALLLGGTVVPAQEADAAAGLNAKEVILPKGNTFTLKTEVSEGKKVKWKSSNPKVAKITEVDEDNGSTAEILAKKAGKAKITAKIGSKTLRAKITVVAKISTSDATKIKAGKKKVSPLAKYGKYQFAVAFYTKNNKDFSGTLRGIKINSSYKLVAKKYGNINSQTDEVGGKKFLRDITFEAEKEFLKKMKISGVTKRYTVSAGDFSTYKDLVMYFNKSGKVKAVLVAKNYDMLLDALSMSHEEGGSEIDIKTQGNVLYVK